MEKYQIWYMPGRKRPKDDGKIFNTEDEAWEYLKERTDKCLYKVPIKNSKGCQSCLAEWSVDTIIK